jgi:hypothetical protein
VRERVRPARGRGGQHLSRLYRQRGREQMKVKDLIKQLKIDPNTTYLDPATQDLLFTTGLVGQRRKKVDAYVKGQSDDREGAILELAKEFASVGIPYDMTIGNKKLSILHEYDNIFKLFSYFFILLTKIFIPLLTIIILKRLFP